MSWIIEVISIHDVKIYFFCGILALGITVCIVETLNGTDKRSDKDEQPKWPL